MSTAAPACDTCLQEAASGSPREARSSRTSSAVGGGSERYGEVEGSLMSDGTTFSTSDLFNAGRAFSLAVSSLIIFKAP